MYYCKSGEVLQFGFSSNPHSQRFVFAYQLRISIKENKMTITKFQCAISHLVRNNLKTPAGFHHLHLGPVCTQRQRGWNAWEKKRKKKTTQTPLFKSLNFEDRFDLDWTQLLRLYQSWAANWGCCIFKTLTNIYIHEPASSAILFLFLGCWTLLKEASFQDFSI